MKPRIDAHVHIWGDGRTHPFSPLDGLTAPAQSATLDELLDEGGADLEGILAIQPSQYGYRHAYLFEAVSIARELVATPEIRVLPLVDPAGASRSRLARFAAMRDVAGVRVTALARRRSQKIDSAEWESFWQAVADLGLTVGILLDPDGLTRLQRVLETVDGLVVVIDHLARISPTTASHWSHLRALTRLAEHPSAHVKLSALDALSGVHSPHRDMWPIVREVLSAYGPDRCMYGTDWPYSRGFGRYQEAATPLVEAILDGGFSEDVIRVLDATAGRIFGFGSSQLD